MQFWYFGILNCLKSCSRVWRPKSVIMPFKLFSLLSFSEQGSKSQWHLSCNFSSSQTIENNEIKEEKYKQTICGKMKTIYMSICIGVLHLTVLKTTELNKLNWHWKQQLTNLWFIDDHWWLLTCFVNCLSKPAEQLVNHSEYFFHVKQRIWILWYQIN